MADDRGYFTITAPLSTHISIRRPDGNACVQRAITSLVDTKTPALLYRFGKIHCATGPVSRAEDAVPDGRPVHDKLAGLKAGAGKIAEQGKADHRGSASPPLERKSVVEGTSVYARVALGGRSRIKKK